MSKIEVIRGNKIVEVTENELEKYLSKGYVIRERKLGRISAQPTLKEEPAIIEEPKKETIIKSNTQAKRNRKK